MAEFQAIRVIAATFPFSAKVAQLSSPMQSRGDGRNYQA
jgi:hypothetical protein